MNIIVITEAKRSINKKRNSQFSGSRSIKTLCVRICVRIEQNLKKTFQTKNALFSYCEKLRKIKKQNKKHLELKTWYFRL